MRAPKDVLSRALLLAPLAVAVALPQTVGVLSVSAGWLLLVVLPGNGFLRLFPITLLRDGDNLGLLDAWFESTVVGVMCLSLWLSLADMASIPLVYAVTVFGGLGVALWLTKGTFGTLVPSRIGWEYVLVVSLIALGTVRAVLLSRANPGGTDVLAHLDGVRQVVATGEVFPHMPRIDGMAGLRPDPRFGTWHGMLAGIWKLAGGPLWSTWAWVGIWMIGPILIAMERVARAIFRSAAAGAVCLFVYLLLMPRVEADLFSIAALPSVVARSVVGFIVLWLWRGLDESKSFQWNWGLVVLAAGLSLFRLDYYMMVGGVIGILACVGACGLGGEIRWLWSRRLGIWVLSGLPFLIYKYWLSLPTPPGYMSRHLAGALLLGGKWWMTDVFQVGPLVGVLWLLGIIWLAKERAALDQKTWLLLSVLCLGAVQAFNPLFCRVLEPLVSAPYIMRLVKLFPIYLLVTGMVLGLTRRTVGGERTHGGVLMGFLTLILVLLASNSSLRNWSASFHDRKADHSYGVEPGILEWLRAHGNSGVIVLAHPSVGYAIAGLTDLSIVAAPPSHASPWVIDARQRERDADRTLSQCTSLQERRRILEKYQAQWVCFKEEKGTAEDWGSARVLHEENGWKLLDVPPKRENLESPEDDCSVEFPSNPSHGRILSVGDEIDALIDWPDTVRVTQGSTTTLPLIWKAEAPIPDRKIWVLRFDQDYPHGLLYWKSWSKPYRKLQENLSGGRYRFRVEGRPCNDRPSVFSWVPSQGYRDELEVTVPHDVHRGIYRVELRIRPFQFMQSYHPGDYLSDHDLWSGVDCGTVLLVGGP